MYVYEKIFFSCLFGLFLVYIFYFQIKSEKIISFDVFKNQEIIRDENFTIPELAELTEKTYFPLIVGGTTFFHGKSLTDVDFLVDSFKNCPFQCIFSANRSLYPIADAAIFHAHQISFDSFIKNSTNPNRLNVFFTMETSSNENIRRKSPNDFFNVSLTFRRDSTIFLPYDKFAPIDSETKNDEIWTDEQVEEKLKKKAKLALQFVSHCSTDSKRESYLKEMMKYANISVFGRCNGKKCDYEKCFPNELETHYFYLAFENSVAIDYVTEKFWRIKQLIVPVVLKRSILKGLVDDEYFLAADDFKTPKELVEKMGNLSKNLTEYKKFLGWTKWFKKTRAKLDAGCQLCKMLHKKERHRISNIIDWYHWKSGTESKFAEQIIK